MLNCCKIWNSSVDFDEIIENILNLTTLLHYWDLAMEHFHSENLYFELHA